MEDVFISTTKNAEGLMLAWSLKSGSVLQTFRGNESEREGTVVVGRTVLGSLSEKATVQSWSWGREQPAFRSSSGERLACLAASPDGRHLLGGTAGGGLLVWELGTGELVNSVDGHHRAVVAARFLDSQSFLTVGQDGAAHLWALWALSAPLYTWAEHTLPITDLVAGTGPRARFATSSLDRTVRLFDLPSRRMLSSQFLPAAPTCLALSPAEDMLLAGTAAGVIHHGEQELRGHVAPLTALLLLGTRLVSADASGTLHIWDLASRLIVRTLAAGGPSPGLHLVPAHFQPVPIQPLKRHKRFAGEQQSEWKAVPAGGFPCPPPAPLPDSDAALEAAAASERRWQGLVTRFYELYVEQLSTQ